MTGSRPSTASRNRTSSWMSGARSVSSRSSVNSRSCDTRAGESPTVLARDVRSLYSPRSSLPCGCRGRAPTSGRLGRAGASAPFFGGGGVIQTTGWRSTTLSGKVSSGPRQPLGLEPQSIADCSPALDEEFDVACLDASDVAPVVQERSRGRVSIPSGASLWSGSPRLWASSILTG